MVNLSPLLLLDRFSFVLSFTIFAVYVSAQDFLSHVFTCRAANRNSISLKNPAIGQSLLDAKTYYSYMLSWTLK